MVMHGQTTDFMDVLFGETNLGEVNFVVPREREFDQELEFDDITDLIQSGDEISFMDSLLDNGCQVSEDITADTTLTDVTETPSTSDTTPSESSYFTFPTVGGVREVVTRSPETSYLDDTADSSYLSCATSEHSAITTTPSTPSTASSDDSSLSRIPTFLTQKLQLKIQARRLKEGKSFLVVETKEPEPDILTPEEEEQRRIRREKNKLAAQKCRSKKRERADVLESETKKLKSTQDELKNEIQKLKEERDRLKDIIDVHSAVCPGLRAYSASF